MGPGSGAIAVEVPVVVVVQVVYAAGATFEVIDCCPVVCVVIGVTVVIVAIVVTTVPRGVSVEAIVAIDNRSAAPVTIPGVPAPTTTTAAGKSTKGHSSTEADHACGRHISRCVSGGNVWRTVNYRGIVFGDIDDLRIRGLNDDRFRCLLYDGHLRCRFEVARSPGLRTQSLDRCHHFRRLVVIGLSQRG